MRTPAQNAELALLLEVAGTPKPGNVDREREYPDLRFEHFLAGAVGARPGLDDASDGVPVGEAFERAVSGMSEQDGGNTQFGALLLLTPLVRTADALAPENATAIVEETTVEDAANFYRAFDHVEVSTGDLPSDVDALDVRRGSDAVLEIRERGLTLYDVMEESAEYDGVAREWVGGFERTFRAADRIADADGPVSARAADTFLWMLARQPDTFVAKEHGAEAARSVMVRAQEAREDGPALVDAFAESLVESGINPGTTADIVAAALFVALERDGVEV
jgi:triphosphoribosyl-dephospho-CoA synthase